MLWSYGITTVPSRMQTTLPRTIESLKRAGFDRPRLFVDGWYGSPYFQELPVTVRVSPIKIVGNWMASMWELYTREPLANRFALFQDDILALPNLRQYLERCPYPSHGYLNLYTFRENMRNDHKSGWMPSVQRGMGALGLVFNSDAIQEVLASKVLSGKPRSAEKNRSWKRMDGGIVEGMKQAGYQEYIHYPSLLQHTGTSVSTLGNIVSNGLPYQANKLFPGENQDALAYLPKTVIHHVEPTQYRASPQAKVKDDEPILEKAIRAVGADRERVMKFVTSGCNGCKDRQLRNEALHLWAVRVCKGKTANALEYLDYILG